MCVLATTSQETDMVIFRRTWLLRAPRGQRSRRVLLRFPPSVLYKNSLHNREVLEVLNMTLRARIQLRDKASQTMESQTMESQTMESQTVESQTMESQTMESQTMESQTMESQTMESQTMESQTMESQTMESQTMESQTMESQTMESQTVGSQMMEVSKPLQVTPLSERPTRPPADCPSWPTQILWRMNTGRIQRCRQDAAEVTLLEFPLASTGEGFGVVRRVPPSTDPDLERMRRRAVAKPSASLSMWIYLLQHCSQHRCSVFHHINTEQLYDSPLIQLSDKGDIVLQTHLTEGGDEAFRTNIALPLRTWTRLDLFLDSAEVQLVLTWDGRRQVSKYKFQNNIYLDDTDGHFVIGGTRYIPGIRGYYGSVKYYRFGTKKIVHERPHKALFKDLSDFHAECEELKIIAVDYLHEVKVSHVSSATNRGVCVSYFHQFEERTCKQSWSWEAQEKHSALFGFLQTSHEQIQKGNLSMEYLRSALFDAGAAAMFTKDQVEINKTEKSRALLRSASCFRNHKASLLLASIHLSALGQALHQAKGHMYSLIGALGDDRFALMHAGYKHSQGIDGFPKDMDVAYSYYSNIGAQSNIDLGKMHQRKQYAPEPVYLSRTEDLSQRTVIGRDLLDFLKYQAERGDAESQKLLGSMLFWGQGGVSKDPESAAQWLEKSTMNLDDPQAMYDYSILLIKGYGVKRNYSRAAALLRKAAEMGSVGALNVLGWYHGAILKDHEAAVTYFERAASNGSNDGMFNLGVYHLRGDLPERLPQNQTAAFLHFLNASSLGHVAASIEAAHYLSTGELQGLSQDSEAAVRMLKKVCEQNGHLGFMIREALHAYLQGSWQEALLLYVLAAETGLGLAQTNVAHLCAEKNLGEVCQWRYHNYSVLNYDPHPSALLRMGDHFSEQGSFSASVRAVAFYSRAAILDHPQGMFNLFLWIHHGNRLPPSVHHFFNVSLHDPADLVMEKILLRCLKHSEEESMPCALALLWVQTERAVRSMRQNAPQCLLVLASLVSLCVVMVTVPLMLFLERRLRGHRTVPQRARTPSLNHGETGQQQGIMGGGEASHTPAGRDRVSAVDGRLWLSWSCDWALTVAGLCLCVFCTTLLYHLL
uniref:Protein sel-1 homolog 3-like n=1 Tax=Knipowitschia caucasica TaxID=637954 RepID=A0AAV2KTS0_KNICA